MFFKNVEDTKLVLGRYDHSVAYADYAANASHLHCCPAQGFARRWGSWTLEEFGVFTYPTFVAHKASAGFGAWVSAQTSSPEHESARLSHHLSTGEQVPLPFFRAVDSIGRTQIASLRQEEPLLGQQSRPKPLFAPSTTFDFWLATGEDYAE